MKIGVVRNPASGSRHAGRVWPAILARLRAGSADLTVLETRRTGDAARFARQLSDGGADLVIAVGGDGTIGDCVDGILSSGRPDTAFSFVSSGTGSDFARNFEPGRTPVEIVDAILSAPVRQVDAGRLTCVGDDGGAVIRHFANIASLGVSGPTVRAVNRARRGGLMPGSLRFLYHSVMQILRYTPESVRVVLDGAVVHDGPIAVVAVANGGWFGGGMKVAPDADPADGLFDVVIIRGASPLRILMLMNSIYSGAHRHNPLVSMHRARIIDVTVSGGPSARAALMDSDGEAPGRIPARFEILPAALRLQI